MTTQIKRYEWEDALVDAQAAGLIPNGALMVGLKLARAINWSPKGGKPAGLYWANQEALKVVGASRANYFKHRAVLFELGFFTEDRGNLIPRLPEKSLVETAESSVETEKSPVETHESLVDNPLSEDTYSGDTLSEDEFSESAPVVANAPTVTPSFDNEVKDEFEYLGTLRSEDFEDFSLTQENLSFDYLANSEGVAVFTPSLDEEVEDPQESLVETGPVKDGKYWREIRSQRPLTPDEKAEIEATSRAYKLKERAETEAAREALVSDW